MSDSRGIQRESSIETDTSPPEIRLRGNPEGGFCWQDNETYDIFQRIIGPFGIAVYGTLTRKAREGRLTYSLRSLAAITNLSRTTVDRNLKVLEHIGMVRTHVRGGSQESVCELFYLKDLVRSWGGTKASTTRMVERLKVDVTALRKELAGKRKVPPEPAALTSSSLSSEGDETSVSSASQRDASVSTEGRQRPARETQTGTHLLIEKGRIENVLSPTPSQGCNGQRKKSPSNDDETRALLKWAADRFNGVIDEMRAHLLDTSKPPNPNLVNGYAEWEEFGLNSLAVKAAKRCGEGLVLSLSASDPAAARRGLNKYQRKWDSSIRIWFECEVTVELEEAVSKQ